MCNRERNSTSLHPTGSASGNGGRGVNESDRKRPGRQPREVRSCIVPGGLAYELVINDRSGQDSPDPFLFLILRARITATDDTPLAYHVAVLLAGNLFRHLEYHLD